MEGQQVIIPISLLIAVVGPLYGLVGGLYVLLFKHSTNEDRHFNGEVCRDTRDNIRGYIGDVDERSAKGLDRVEKKIDKLIEKLL